MRITRLFAAAVCLLAGVAVLAAQDGPAPQATHTHQHLQALAVARGHQGPLGNALLDGPDDGVLAALQERALSGGREKEEGQQVSRWRE